MAKDADKEWDLAELTAVVRCEDMWEDFQKTVATSAQSRPSDSDLKSATAAILAMLLFGSAQCPGAVLGATIDEYMAATQYEDVWVVSVKEHKTTKMGPARLTMDAGGTRMYEGVHSF